MARVPENTLKFAVGIMLSAFGVFWTGEGLGVAWPGAEIGFMDPAVAARVLHGRRAGQLPPDQRQAFLAGHEAALAQDFSPSGVASSMTIDEVTKLGDLVTTDRKPTLLGRIKKRK